MSGGHPPLVRPGAVRNVCDLTHTFRTGFPVGLYDPPHRESLAHLENDGFRSNRWSLVEHTATHVDAPAHLCPTGSDVSQLQPADLIVPIAVVDISDRVANNPDTAVTVADVARYEAKQGRLPDSAAVFMRSGWEARVDDADSYNGVSAEGGRRIPGFAADTASWLIDNREITCIGVDSPSIVVGTATGFPVHRRWLAAGRYAVEGLARLSDIPTSGAVAFIGVIPWEIGTGEPCRALAMW